MKLKQVEIYGFKSFAQRTQLSFDRGITGIVGPNGSGKSNIADAVRWVLGEQSAKMLRGAKMEDVIFSGTDRRKAYPYCEVSLLFENADQALHSPFAEVQVSRRVYRNGEGEYYLNKTSCRLKDILELFRDTGIGKEGYSIIGQGRIEEILSTKGEERRQVFEEAAGIVTFRVRKEEAQRKLQKTKENLLRVSDLMDELEARLEPLKIQAANAQTYLALSHHLRDRELNVFLIRYDRLQERINSFTSLTQGLRETLELHEQKLEALAGQRSLLAEELEKLDASDTAARADLAAAQENLYKAQADLAAQISRLDNQRQDAHRMEIELAQAQERLKELESLVAAGEEEAAAHAHRRSEAQAELSQQEDLLCELLDHAQAAEATLDTHKQHIINALNRLSDAKSRQTRQQTMLNQMLSRSVEIKNEAASLLEKQQILARQADEVILQLQMTQSQLAASTQEQQRCDQQTLIAQQAMNINTQNTQKLANDLQHTQNRLQLLEEMARDYEGYNQAVKKALQFSKVNPQVHGVIAQLLQVPRDFETAIDMILGGTLQHIVTEDEETAKAIIDYLRLNKLGRTTFLPLTSIRPRLLSKGERALLASPGCLGVASELISCAPKYRGIMENILGRTVLVTDLEAAIPLSRKAHQAFNVVTLAGDVMRAGGAMTGGTAQGRTTSLLGREREIAELRLALGQGQTELIQAQDRLKQLRQGYENLHSLAAEALEAVNQLQIALARDQERSQNASKELTSSVIRLEALEQALDQLSQSMRDIQQDLDGAALDTQTVTVDNQAMEAETLQYHRALHEARQLAEAQRARVSTMQVKRSELLHQADLYLRDKERWQKEDSAMQTALFKGREKHEQLLLQISQTQSAQSDKEIILNRCEENVRHEQSRSQVIAAQRGKTQLRQRACLDEREKLYAQYQQDSDKLHRNEMVSERTQSEQLAMSDHIFNSYELTYSLAQEYRQEEKLDLPKAEMEIKEIKGRIREMGPVNVTAIEDYAQTKARYDSMTTQRDDAMRAQDDLEKLIEKLLGRMEEQFVEEFNKLNNYFSMTFSRLFGGGQAQLILTDPSAPLACDIEVEAQPPGKKLQMLSLLSGGERALTAIAILFAMLKLKPTPFCILDEIEAALDEANIGHFADYLAEYAQSTQFIVITHRKGTMERCDALYGVAMEEKGVSGMVSVDLQRFS